MKIDNKIIKEIERYHKINKYVLEQEVPPPPGGEAALPPPPGGEAALPPPAAPTTGSTPVDLATDTEVEKIGDEKKDKKETEEVDVTDLVTSQKNIGDKQEEYFDTLFKHMEDLESKLSVMDNMVEKLNNLEQKIEKMKPKTPQEKLELRSLDSGPFNQKLTDFFDDKLPEMERSGKNEYVISQEDVENFNPNEIRKSFRNFEDESEQLKRFY
jgi:uncharacterized coiled-coil protein SlyX